MSRKICLLFLFAIVFAAGCSNQTVVAPDANLNAGAVQVQAKPAVPAVPAVSDITKNSNKFALSFYKQLNSQDRKSNLFFSPFSIWTAYAMLYEGADGQTLQEMKAVFGFNPNIDARRAAMQTELAQYKASSSSVYGIGIANSLWVNKGFPIREYFKYVLGTYYFATATNTVNATQINKWVNNNTFGRIKNLFDSSVNQSQLVLVNTIYFKSRWLLEFDKEDTQKDNFFVTKVNPVSVDMMTQTSRFAYYENAQVQMLKMKYKDGRPASMIVILPKNYDVNTAWEFLQSAQDLNSLLEYNQVTVTFPKFEIDYAIELKNLIAKLGLTASDFSRISDLSLMISQAVHKAYIKVDEKETEAAAATGIAMVTSAPVFTPPIIFKADRPFIYLIVDESDGRILFMGRMMNPAKSN